MTSQKNSERRANRLAEEKSPYLQQHAYNPVNWFPWGEQAFLEARRRDVPIFLSIGYATCHWCHVMERESFEDEQTASMMNNLFVNVKVDREERPDVDAIYMVAAQAMTGAGGWPLSVWLTPDKLLPFYAGTYYPPESRYGRPGLRELHTALRQAWDNDRERVEESALQITEAVRRGTEVNLESPLGDFTPSALEELVTNLRRGAMVGLTDSYDAEHGGFGPAPKFPLPSAQIFLLATNADPIAEAPTPIEMVSNTMRQISLGGIYDHLGGGFSRYSTDREWTVPHFEKMLYDQAQLLEVLGRLQKASPDQLWEARIRATISYLKRDLQRSDGPFFSAEDADSEGREGTFYVWTLEEIGDVLGPDLGPRFAVEYGVTAAGNFEGGTNVLRLDPASESSLSRSEVADALRKLLSYRHGRERPERDEKVVTAWNGLLLSGLSHAYRALSDPTILSEAENLATWMLENLFEQETLMRRMVGDELRYNAYLDDHAFLIRGLVDLFDATGNPDWIVKSVELTERAISLFHDEIGGGFFMTDGSDTNLPVRSKSEHDGAEPAGNSIMAWVLARLGRLLDDERYRNLAAETLLLFGTRIMSYPDVMPMLILAGEILASPQESIVVVEAAGDEESFERLLAEARALQDDMIDVVAIPQAGAHHYFLERLPYLAAMKPTGSHSVVYRCRNFTCEAPTTELNARV